jgi:integrase
VHQRRHTCARFMIMAGANAKALSVVLGHASIAITFDLHGHLMKGGEDEVGRLLDRYINGA